MAEALALPTDLKSAGREKILQSAMGIIPAEKVDGMAQAGYPPVCFPTPCIPQF